MSEPEKTGLFRQESLEAAMAPEALDEYLRVTTPGAWLMLAAILALLAGTLVWGFFGRVQTTARVAVSVEDGEGLCCVPCSIADGILAHRVVTLAGREYPLAVEIEPRATMLPEDTPLRLLQAGELRVGDQVLLVPLEVDLADGVYAGDALIEDLRPISLLLR